MIRLRVKLDPDKPVAGPLSRRERWLRAIPWIISVVTHGLVCLVLGVALFLGDPAGGGGGIGDGLTGLFGGEESGDLTALTNLDGLGDSQSLFPQGADALIETIMTPTLAAVDTAMMRPPALDERLRGGATPLDGSAGLGEERPRGLVGEGQRLGDGKPSKVPLSGRNGPLKTTLLQIGGATPASEAAVERGLAWLARHQRYDGSWCLDTSEMCREAVPCPPSRAMSSDTAATGLALLAFLGAGHSHTKEGRYQANVTRGLKWLVNHRTGDGNFYTGGAPMAHLYSQAIATMAVCEAYALTEDPALKTHAEKGLGFILRAQNKLEGGWRYTPTIDGDTSVFGWQMFALRSGQFAGFNVPKKTVSLSRLYLDHAATDKRRVTYGYQPGRPAMPVMTAEALLCRQYLGWAKDDPRLVEGVSLIAGDLEAAQGRNIYYWYYATQLLHNMGGSAWKNWNERVREGLVAEQIQQRGCALGSWDPAWPQEDQWGARAGRLYQTALSLLTLEVYYRFLPLYKTDDLEIVGNEMAKDKEPDKQTP